MSGEATHSKGVLAGVCVAGPALVALIPMAAAPAMPSMAAHFAPGGDGQLFAQLVMTAPAVMLIISSPLAGLLATRIGRRATLLMALVLFSLAGSGVLLIESRAALIALRLLLGVAGGGLLTSSLALIGEHFESRAREKVLGFAVSVSSLVAALALVFGGGLVDALGWRAPFALYLLGIPVLLAALRVVPQSAARLAQDRTAKQAVLAPLGGVLPYYLLLMLLTIGMFTPAIQVPFLLERRGIASAQAQGMIIAATSIVAIFSAGLFGWIRRWLDVRSILVIDALCMASGIVAITSLPTMGGAVFGCALIGIGAGLSEPAIASLVFDRTPPRIHALAMGLIVSALNAGQFVNPLAMAPLRDWIGVSGSFLALAALLLLAAVLLQFLPRTTRHPVPAS